MKTQLLLTISALLPAIASATEDYKPEIDGIDGIYYQLDSTKMTATVCYRQIAIYDDLEDAWLYPDFAPHRYSGDITIPDTVIYDSHKYAVTSLGDNCFALCSQMTSLHLPSTLTTLGQGCFTSLSSLQSISVSEESQTFFAYDRILYRRSTECQIAYVPQAIEGDVEIIDCCTSVMEGAFDNCKRITSVTIPSSVETIRPGAFANCSKLEEIYLEDGLQNIETRAFMGCTSLSLISIPNTVTTIGASAFAGCTNLTFVMIYDGSQLQTIDKMAFYDCTHLCGITLPSKLTTIGESAFKECTSLSQILNNSTLTLTMGSTDNGYVAYYATDIYSASADIPADTSRYSLLRSANSKITLSNMKGLVHIYSANGQLIMSIRPSSDTETITVPSDGIYIAKSSK